MPGPAPVPTPQERHLLTRLGTGYTPAGLGELRAAGGTGGWLERQLAPERIPLDDYNKAFPSWFPGQQWAPATRVAKARSGEYNFRQHGHDLANLTLLRRIYSPAQLLETMVSFWSDHFHIPVHNEKAWIVRPEFDQTLRRFALSNFETLLLNVTVHPSMLLFLDNFRSTASLPNENHARELLELHTVGRGSGFTEAMVKSAAKALSGYTINSLNWQTRYDPGKHATGPISVMGYQHPNNTVHGAGVAQAMLRHLARHPATARRISLRLAQKFVADQPPQDLIEAMARSYLASGTDIRATLRTMVGHQSFWNSAGGRVRTPYEEMVALARSVGVRAFEPKRRTSLAYSWNYIHRGLPLFEWPSPDGPPLTTSGWTSISRMLGSFAMHGGFATRAWQAEAYWPRPVDYLPASEVTLAQWVRHLHTAWHGTQAKDSDLRAAHRATGYPSDARIRAGHPLTGHRFAHLALAVLDTPTSMQR